MSKSNIETVQVEAAEAFLFYSFLLRTRGREVLRSLGDRHAFNY